MIVFDRVCKRYQDNAYALNNISFKINDGDFVFLTGESGAGKSTIIKLLLRKYKATDGEIYVDGQDISEFPHKDIPHYRRQLGIVFQDYKLLPKRTVYENIAFALIVLDVEEEQIDEKVKEVLSYVGLSGKENRYPNELSGGEQQRVAIARAIVNHPKILLADEPTGNLDENNADEISRLFFKINHDMGTTVIMATHDKRIVKNYCNVSKRMELENGKMKSTNLEVGENW